MYAVRRRRRRREGREEEARLGGQDRGAGARKRGGRGEWSGCRQPPSSLRTTQSTPPSRERNQIMGPGKGPPPSLLPSFPPSPFATVEEKGMGRAERKKKGRKSKGGSRGNPLSDLTGKGKGCPPPVGCSALCARYMSTYCHTLLPRTITLHLGVGDPLKKEEGTGGGSDNRMGQARQKMDSRLVLQYTMYSCRHRR